MIRLEDRLKELIITELKVRDVVPADVADDDLLFGGTLGLDSLDAVELVVVLKKHFGIEVKDRNTMRAHFESIATLAAYIRSQRPDL